ncbi:nicotinamidase [Acetobacter orientalis]|uniref:nicotinamidase n=1 Tax=Acetobacter orientalis TaxID=146474 RepID=A0A251ZX50_9PROT|nr:nicotinamidase [Acetobacter orientalis]MDN6042473.1 nicotinamidase [Acetobacter sp.]MCP1217058.1 nicotinamidase [Acetobacter orientalis]MCP1219962.1 nicotinamidase [Acetobacter orientalis]MCP1222402.1 nicotinamidase [Acetobacter orientalis]OUI79248.1 isochorismatase [Acetobacter orientalis]
MPISPQDALIIVDMQNDFLPGGALGIAGADRLIPTLNTLLDQPFGASIATQDWHPAGHCSFTPQGGPWPTHCVQGTQGAELAALLRTDTLCAILRKGMAQAVDSYSAFTDNNGQNPTGLAGLLRERGIKRVIVCGLALDVCVADTALAAQKLGFESVVLADASASAQEDPTQVANRLRAGGVSVLTITAL